ncbi:alpha/beta hydrolase family protein [Micromonospora inyonensis]|uniref:Alpha/beta hydrolase family protein n=1 Tax=Micromonospora inyonensis TaxID=47866 RepID=A0A1C6R8J3_9ACTN|nr:alpha/beta hydrolase [Micromonospora inyonensis]SCL13304.1 Alpha/beta hydrolase family protein [Micromonospora inyonensis]
MKPPRLLAALLLTVLLAGCGTATAAPGTAPPPRPAPREAYAVGVRTLTVEPGSARPLPVTVWYPAAGRSAAPGRFPVVLYSHGLRSVPALHAALTTRWAAAGFVVAAPTYPNTNLRSARFNRADVRNQPADAWRVVRHVIRLDGTPGDLLAGHLETGRVAAAGHSAGGFTTAGMFTSGHPARLRAGVIIAAGGMAGSFAGPPAALLFVHGGADQIVPWHVGRAGYDRTDWPRAFLTLPGQGHGEYLTPDRPGFAQVLAATTDLLRWRLYDDPAAGRRIAAGARLAGVTSFEDRLGIPH